MRILALSVNHRTAPVELREKLSLTGDRLESALRTLRAAYPAAESVILSTCNRTELYLARPSHDAPGFEQVVAFLSARCGVEPASVAGACLQRENDHAIAHLFRVCSGLESMVLGEPQILGQVRRAYEFASEREAVGPVLHRVFQHALAVGKRVRTETGIDSGRVSIASVAVEFARQVFDRFDNKTVVAIGAGEMGKLLLRHLLALGPGRLWLTNRTLERAHDLASGLGLTPDRGGVRQFETLDELLVEADVILTCTGATSPIITAERFKPLIRRRRSRPICIVDAAVPRDVEPAVGRLTNVYLHDLDDLQRVVGQTHGKRSEQVEACEAILLAAVRECTTEVRRRDVGQLARSLREKLLELGTLEKERTLRKLAGAKPEDLATLLDEHTHRLVNKILHLPLSQLDRRDAETSMPFYAAALRRLFDLPEEHAPATAPEPAPPVVPPPAPPTPPPPATLPEAAAARATRLDGPPSPAPTNSLPLPGRSA
ncbi:MAG: glutamyl-tRNA reductase [Planctomycetota bacterium]|nr:glutamyl-tRNA reductase [Planctomycetota bacterium]